MCDIKCLEVRAWCGAVGVNLLLRGLGRSGALDAREGWLEGF